MFSLFRKRRQKTLSGIVADEFGTAVVTVRNPGQTNCTLQSCDFEPAASADLVPNPSLLTDRGLDRHRCSTLLNTGEYQLLAVDAPEVPAQELRAAVRWKIQELIDFHVDEAVLDVFDAPPGGPAGTRKQMYVVVSQKEIVKKRIDMMEQKGVNLKIIDIPELAMRNLVSRLPEDESGLVTLYFSQQQCQIILTQNATLYLTRTVDFRYSDIHAHSRNPIEFSNRLALEIQRSLDYYEQHFQKAAIQTIVMLPPPVDLDGLEEALQESLGLKIRTIAMSDILGGEYELPTRSAASCMLALGCAMRAEKKAL